MLVALIVSLAPGCARAGPPPSTPAGYRTVAGRGWSFAVPRGWSEVRRPPAIVELREPSTAPRGARRVVLLRVGRTLAIGPEQPPSPVGNPGVEMIGVRAGPAERTFQRTSSTGALGLTLRCTTFAERDRICDAILGTFRMAP